MRTVTSVTLALMVALGSGCASIPLSTALSLSSMSPRALAQIDPADVRVRISVPVDFEIDVPKSQLSLGLTTSSGVSSAAMNMSLLEVTKESRSGGLFKPDIPVSTYLLVLSDDGADALKAVQRQILLEDPTGFEFKVEAPFSIVPADPHEVTIWVDLKLSSTDRFMRLIDGAKIKFEHSSASR